MMLNIFEFNSIILLHSLNAQFSLSELFLQGLGQDDIFFKLVTAVDFLLDNLLNVLHLAGIKRRVVAHLLN